MFRFDRNGKSEASEMAQREEGFPKREVEERQRQWQRGRAAPQPRKPPMKSIWASAQGRLECSNVERTLLSAALDFLRRQHEREGHDFQSCRQAPLKPTRLQPLRASWKSGASAPRKRPMKSKAWATRLLMSKMQLRSQGAGPPSRHHNRGCPIRRGFRRMGTTNADAMWDQKANAPRVTRGFQIPNAVCETSLG